MASIRAWVDGSTTDELKLFEDQREAVQLTSIVSSVVDPSTQARIDAIRDRLCTRFGYSEGAAEEVLRYVSELFARGEPKDEPRDAA
ncbi:MAG: hypothetical protein AAFY46_06205 [Planctomycetota bacterium]